LTGQEIKM